MTTRSPTEIHCGADADQTVLATDFGVICQDRSAMGVGGCREGYRASGVICGALHRISPAGYGCFNGPRNFGLVRRQLQYCANGPRAESGMVLAKRITLSCHIQPTGGLELYQHVSRRPNTAMDQHWCVFRALLSFLGETSIGSASWACPCAPFTALFTFRLVLSASLFHLDHG